MRKLSSVVVKKNSYHFFNFLIFVASSNHQVLFQRLGTIVLARVRVAVGVQALPEPGDGPLRNISYFCKALHSTADTGKRSPRGSNHEPRFRLDPMHRNISKNLPTAKGLILMDHTQAGKARCCLPVS